MREVRTKSQLVEVFRFLRLRPARALGQNFLVDPNLLDFIVRAAQVGPEDLVLDIGCGTGLLTAHLADAAARVIGIELDRGILAVCRRYLEGRANVELLSGDALASKHALSPALLEAARREWSSGRYRALRVVSNLPYSAASAIVPNLLECGLPIAGMLVTVQKEVAERLVAGVGHEHYGALSLVVQANAQVELVRLLPPEVFWPRPKVTSAVVRLTPFSEARATAGDFEALKTLARAAFAHRRKTLVNSLAASHLLPQADAVQLLTRCDVPASVRAQDVGLSQYLLLARCFSQRKGTT